MKPENPSFLQQVLCCLIVWNSIVLSLFSLAEGPRTPRARDFAYSAMSKKMKEKFVDLHNEYRGKVDPPAANMNYLIWNDDLANLAQMWSNKCRWEHGFVEFGDEYPKQVSFKGRLGQNLALEWGKPFQHISEAAILERVTRWWREARRYRYSKYAYPMSQSQCSKRPCGHYTQVAWAESKYLGCGLNWCNRELLGISHPYVPGETIVACNYGPSGNLVGQYPYRSGKPCSKCASGNGFCFKNLCRDCADFDGECGRTLSRDLCRKQPELMAKKCPKMCNLCECPLVCRNGGTLNKRTCTCACNEGWSGTDCSDLDTKPRKPVPTTIPLPTAHPGPDPSPGPVPSPGPSPVTEKPSVGAGSETHCECASVLPTRPQGCQDLDKRCPLWAYKGECEKNTLWMIEQGNCLWSCNQCGECRDMNFGNCMKWASKSECEKNPVYMLENCRSSCGMCQAYDSKRKCKVWSQLGECIKNPTWMVKNCGKSCKGDICRDKLDGNYTDLATSQGFVICSKGKPTHALCPYGQLFSSTSKTCAPLPKVYRSGSI